MGCFVRGDKNSMGCFVQGGKSLWDVLPGVSKSGMGCFVPGCFVRLPFFGHLLIFGTDFFSKKKSLGVPSEYQKVWI